MNSPPSKPEDPQQSPAEKVVERVKPYLRPDKVNEARKAVTLIMQKLHQGPLPAPEDFQHYDETLPGAAERILHMAEKEQDHRHTVERELIRSEYRVQHWGQAGAVLSLLALLGTVVMCALMGQPIAASVIGAVGVIVIGFLKYSTLKFQSDGAHEPVEPEPKSASKKHR